MAEPQNRRVALLSIRPRFADAILGGEKTVELRRGRLSPDVSHVAVYATAPIKRIVGWFEVYSVERDRPCRLWLRHRAGAGVSAAEFRTYFRGAVEGTAIGVGRVVALKEPMALADLGSVTAPQSFCYLDETTIDGLFAAGGE